MKSWINVYGNLDFTMKPIGRIWCCWKMKIVIDKFLSLLCGGGGLLVAVKQLSILPVLVFIKNDIFTMAT